MRKLKKINLAQNQILNAKDMEILEGGDFIPFECNHEHQACVYLVPGAGVYTGTCYYYDNISNEGKHLECKPN